MPERTGRFRIGSRRSPLELLRAVLDGHLAVTRRGWADDTRVFELSGRACRALTLSEQDLAVLALAARGGSNSEIGWVLDMGPSSISRRASLVGLALGLEVVDFALFGPFLEPAADDARATGASFFAAAQSDDRALLTIEVPPEIRQRLTAAEMAVARDVADGRSIAEIAAARGTSHRTVANQIAAVYRALGARGKRECVLRLYGGTLTPIDRNAIELMLRLVGRPPALTAGTRGTF